MNLISVRRIFHEIYHSELRLFASICSDQLMNHVTNCSAGFVAPTPDHRLKLGEAMQGSRFITAQASSCLDK